MSATRKKAKSVGPRKGPALVPGDRIGIIALSSPAAGDRVLAGLKELESLGYKTEVALDPARYYGKHDHLFSSDSAQNRAIALMDLFEDEGIKAILAVRGAYGCMEALPYFDFRIARRNPKPVIGFSDTTAFLVALYQSAGIVSIHGPSLEGGFARAAADEAAKKSGRALIDLLSTKASSARHQFKCIKSGRRASGRLIGGNLSMLAALAGTPWQPQCAEHILFIEDIGEKPYRVHRMLFQLKLAGALEGVKGVVLGSFSKSGTDQSGGPGVEEAVLDIFEDTRVPILAGGSFGHEQPNYPMPIGIRASIDESNLEFLEAPVA